MFRDEGPSSSGKFGPYFQSQRKQIYMDAVEKLIESGHAYRCFCTKTVRLLSFFLYNIKEKAVFSTLHLLVMGRASCLQLNFERSRPFS